MLRQNENRYGSRTFHRCHNHQKHFNDDNNISVTKLSEECLQFHFTASSRGEKTEFDNKVLCLLFQKKQSDKVWKAFSMLIHNWKRLWLYGYKEHQRSPLFHPYYAQLFTSLHYWKTLFSIENKSVLFRNSLEFILV